MSQPQGLAGFINLAVQGQRKGHPQHLRKELRECEILIVRAISPTPLGLAPEKKKVSITLEPHFLPLLPIPSLFSPLALEW